MFQSPQTHSIAGQKVGTPVARSSIFFEIIDAVDAHWQCGLLALQAESLKVLACKLIAYMVVLL